jgi:hypothetical protein
MDKIVAITTPVDNESGVLKKHKVFILVECEEGLRRFAATVTPDNCYEVRPQPALVGS